MIRFSLFVKLLILLLPLTFNAMAYEEATYSTVYQNNIYEIRKYSDRLAIQVNYTNQNSGFRKLFNYISGSNIDSKKINMTIPLTQSNENGDMVMQFFLPSNFTKKDAPAPTNNKVKLVVIEEGYYAVLKYSGRLTNKNFDKNKKNLRENLLKDNIVILSSAINAIYNGPFTLPFLRRNEAIFRIDWKNK
tara:strand:- start:808 stop:1377 length:570 start_codon:yes stop_codon:yes gene_type:complete